jgi:HEAT repeats
MKWRVFLTLLLAAAMVGPAPAGIFGKKPTKPSPTERVPELLSILKSDGDENKRLEAAQELRQYDPLAFPQIVPSLIAALQNDAKPSVRSEAAQTLGQIRPVLPAVRPALEVARDKDASMRVRFQARSSLLGIRWTTTWHGNPSEPPSQGKEPPLADPKSKNVPPAIRTQQPQPMQDPGTGRLNPVAAPNPPPPATPQVQEQNPQTRPAPASTTSSTFRWMPLGQSKKNGQTAEPPLAPPTPEKVEKTIIPPTAVQKDQTGPDLGPPPE